MSAHCSRLTWRDVHLMHAPPGGILEEGRRKGSKENATPSVLAPVEHIRVDAEGVAWIAGTTTKVLEVVMDKLAHDWSPEEIQKQHYGEPSLAQIHAAFAYYYDHQAELDAEIERECKECAAMWEANRNSPVKTRLRSLGLIP